MYGEIAFRPAHRLLGRPPHLAIESGCGTPDHPRFRRAFVEARHMFVLVPLCPHQSVVELALRQVLLIYRNRVIPIHAIVTCSLAH